MQHTDRNSTHQAHAVLDIPAWSKGHLLLLENWNETNQVIRCSRKWKLTDDASGVKGLPVRWQDKFMRVVVVWIAGIFILEQEVVLMRITELTFCLWALFSWLSSTWSHLSFRWCGQGHQKRCKTKPPLFCTMWDHLQEAPKAVFSSHKPWSWSWKWKSCKCWPLWPSTWHEGGFCFPDPNPSLLHFHCDAPGRWVDIMSKERTDL